MYAGPEVANALSIAQLWACFLPLKPTNEPGLQERPQDPRLTATNEDDGLGSPWLHSAVVRWGLDLWEEHKAHQMGILFPKPTPKEGLSHLWDGLLTTHKIVQESSYAQQFVSLSAL